MNKKTCPDCNSENVIKYGKPMSKTKGRFQRFKCNDCGRIFSEKKE